jgi:hypothetical protein
MSLLHNWDIIVPWSQFPDNFGILYDRFPLFPIIYLSLHLFAFSSLVIFLSYASRIHR